MLSISELEKSKKEYWRDPSKLLSALTVVIPILFLVILSLAVFIKPVGGTCNTHSCMEQANKLQKRMNIEVNPCDDFYEFVCGNTLKDSSERNVRVETNEQLKRDLLKLYKEDIKGSDHKIVKIEKKLFRNCMNEEKIEKDDLTRIKEVINEVGGWPVLDEVNTNKTKFDWVEATYKLRELGYPFSIFFNVDVTRDMENKKKFYLQITMHNEQDQDEIMSKFPKREAAEIMAKVAKEFGAKNQDLAVDEMMEVYEFRQKSEAPYSPHEKYTIEEYQKKYDKEKQGPFKWLGFLKQLVGPKIIVSSYDYVSVQGVEAVSGWINILSTTSERTLGNYMIWKLIEANIPYLPKKIQNITKYSSNVSREEFCLRETNKRFLQSPIQILNTKRLLSTEERQRVQETFLDIKHEFLNLLDRTVWMEDRDQELIRKNAENLTLVYGLPQDYFSDKIFEDMDVDLVETKGDTFLDVLTQANRNRQTILFQVITSSAAINVNSRSYIRDKYPFLLYNKAENELFVPVHLAYRLQKYTQKSFKYSFIGAFFSTFLARSLSEYDTEFGVLENQLSERTKYVSKKMSECLETQIHKHNVSQEEWVAKYSLIVSAGEKASYLAYVKWLKNNEEKDRLPGLNYTSRQLFWIVSTYCHVPDLNMDDDFDNAVEVHSLVSLLCKLNNPYFARDFQCPEGSESNPIVNCPLYL